jgi:hypothetical protein
MKLFFRFGLGVISLVGLSLVAWAGDVRTDYDHGASFAQYKTYSWGKVQTSDPFFVDRVHSAVDKQLAAKGWSLVPSNGAVMVFATDKIHSQKEVQTVYDTFGGGWGGMWGWGGWGWGGLPNPGFADSTSTTTDVSVGNLVVDMFDGNSKKLLWRGLATEDLSSNANKNTKALDGDIKKMFKDFPPKSGAQ